MNRAFLKMLARMGAIILVLAAFSGAAISAQDDPTSVFQQFIMATGLGALR